MTIKKQLVLLLLTLTAFASAFSDNSSETNRPQHEAREGMLHLYSAKTDKKRMPSYHYLTIYYDGGVLTLNSESVTDIFAMELVGNQQSDVIQIPALAVGESIAISLYDCEYSVTATGSTGMTFTGTLTSE